MQDIVIIKKLLDVQHRRFFFNEILNQLKNFSNVQKIHSYEFRTSEGIIPIIIIAKSLRLETTKNLKVFLGAQHNEYSGLFGIIEFLNMLKESIIKIEDIFKLDQILIFAPLMNPFGFINPTKKNKSGYYLRNGSNLNRFWSRTFAPEYRNKEDVPEHSPLPEHAKIFRKILRKYWNREEIPIYILDFHETSLFDKCFANLVDNLQKNSTAYKFSHWLEKEIVYNIIKLNNIHCKRNSLFLKCNTDPNHSHLNLTIPQINNVYQYLQKYIVSNDEKLPFYFCHSNRSKDICQVLAQNVYEKLKDILWETLCPAFDHEFINHGCFVNMNDATNRKYIYSMALESIKHFFNIFDEIDKSKSQNDYYDKKVKSFRMSTQLVVESIKEIVNFF